MSQNLLGLEGAEKEKKLNKISSNEKLILKDDIK